MSVTIDLPPDTEAKLREQAARRGTSLEDYLRQLALRWAFTAEDAAMAPAEARTPEQRVADWLAFVNSHQDITAVADDSRESIYEGCGE